MPRRRQADNIKLIIRGKPSPEALPVEIGLSLPCMKEIRERIGGSVVSVDGQLVWLSSHSNGRIPPDPYEDAPEAAD